MGNVSIEVSLDGSMEVVSGTAVKDSLYRALFHAQRHSYYIWDHTGIGLVNSTSAMETIQPRPKHLHTHPPAIAVVCMFAIFDGEIVHIPLKVGWESLLTVIRESKVLGTSHRKIGMPICRILHGDWYFAL